MDHDTEQLAGNGAALDTRSFGSFRLEPGGVLWRGSQRVHIPPKELAALEFFLQHAGDLVTPEQLRQALWGGVHVTADSVPRCISSLRALLAPEDCIQTVFRKGYRFVESVRIPGADGMAALPRMVVLPFRTEFGVPEHYGAHVAEQAMSALALLRPPLAEVMARDSVFTLARRGLSAQQVGEAMHADLALTGLIRALPAHFRVRAELIRVRDGVQVWTEDLLVERDHPEALENRLCAQLLFRLSQSAAAAEGLASMAAEAAHAAPASAHRREASELSQRAHHEWQTLQRHRMQDAMQLLLRATDLDPTLISAWVDLANLCVAQEMFGFLSPSVAYSIIERATVQIPNVEQDAVRLLPALGWLHFH